MSFLTPLYLLGALAISLPIVFHMIRRTPRGRREFSSVMFLEPSPPRMTRRSRIEHWLLLALRALAIGLLAFAFARPFLRTTESAPSPVAAAQDVIVLIDTSASMRRSAIWQDSLARVASVLDEMGPQDRLTLMTFDSESRVLTDFDHWSALDARQRVQGTMSALQPITPGWNRTNLGRALIDAAERLASESGTEQGQRMQTIVLVSDLQVGSHWDELQGYEWPEHVAVRFETVGREVSPTNAGIQALPASAETGLGVRARITNDMDSRREQFQLRWNEPSGEPHDAVTVIVPPGQSRIVAVPASTSAEQADRLVLEGDDHDFDNSYYVSEPRRRAVTVAMQSEHSGDDPQGLRYYVERALLSTPVREVNVTTLDPSISQEGDAAIPALIIVGGKLTPESIAPLQRYLEQGGTLLHVWLDPQDAADVAALAGGTVGDANEAEVRDYAMLTDIQFDHPLFASLNQPRFSDFTRIRFWHHRSIDDSAVPGMRVLARFDDGDAAVGEIPVGSGRIICLTAGWHPEDSQLALSTKFVPMLNGLLDSAAGIRETRRDYLVGEPVPLADVVPLNSKAQRVVTPSGETVAITPELTAFLQTDVPGQYRVEYEHDREIAAISFSVNLDPAESQTALLPADLFETLGIRSESRAAAVPVTGSQARQLRGSELEDQQKLWRWLIVAALGVLLGETWYAARLSRSRPHVSA